MITRIAFDAEFVQAIRVRGLTLTEVARRAEVNIATASEAVHGRPVNIRTALQLSRAVASAPVVPELETWAREPLVPSHDEDSVDQEPPAVMQPDRRRRRGGGRGYATPGMRHGQLRMELP